MKPTNQQVFNQGQELDRWACDLGINRPNEGEEVLYILKAIDGDFNKHYKGDTPCEHSAEVKQAIKEYQAV